MIVDEGTIRYCGGSIKVGDPGCAVLEDDIRYGDCAVAVIDATPVVEWSGRPGNRHAAQGESGGRNIERIWETARTDGSYARSWAIDRQITRNLKPVTQGDCPD